MIADHVIVTVPLGVLKAGDIAFDPPMSLSKQRAIERLGMGLLNKHVLRFERVFWPDTADWHIRIAAQKGHRCEWISPHNAERAAILVAFTAADHADEVERLTDADALAQAVEVARLMFGTALPAPIAHQSTRWRSDALARGSYSFDAVGSSAVDGTTLASDEDGALFFAGEAASHLHPGTVHGALLSGEAAAARVVEAFAVKGSRPPVQSLPQR